MVISKETRKQMSDEAKYKEEIDFLRSLGKFKMWASYYERELEFYRELTKEEVEHFLEIFPNVNMASEMAYAKDFCFRTSDIPDAFNTWFSLNASAWANSGADGNGFSGWISK